MSDKKIVNILDYAIGTDENGDILIDWTAVFAAAGLKVAPTAHRNSSDNTKTAPKEKS